MDAPSIAAVVVAFNRAELLREALDALFAQTVRPSLVIVVDNASTDASAEVASAHPVGARVVRLPRNTGGAGGFAVGLAEALTDPEVDAVWLMDDDTVPTPTALAELLRVRRAARGSVPAVLASRVVWMDGSDHPMNRPRRRPWARVGAPERALAVLPVRSASFVSMLVDGAAARSTRLPLAAYFIWNDDFEYSTRLLRRSRGYYCERSVVLHKTAKPASTDVDPGQRFYYEVRNKLWVFLRSGGLKPVERLLYAGATARRWIRTYRRSSDRAVLRDGLRRGLRDGMVRPQPTPVVLAGLGDATAAVERFEARG